MASWWDELSHKEQKAYLKEHPNSKRKLTKKKNKKKNKGKKKEKPPSNEEISNVSASPVIEGTPIKSNSNTSKKVWQYVRKNPGKVALAVAATMATGRHRYEENVDGMPVVKRNKLAQALRTAIHLKDSEALNSISVKMGVTAGVVSVGLVGLSMFTGVDMSMIVPMLAANFWNDIKEAPNNVEFLKNAGKAYFDRVAQSLNDEVAVIKSLVEKESSTETASMTKKIGNLQMASSHESDLNKALVSLEKFNVEKATEEAIKTGSLHTIMDHIQEIEKAMPFVTDVLVASITKRETFSKRSRKLKSSFKNAHSTCVQELAKSLVDTPPVTPMRHVLNKNLKFDNYKTTMSYVTTPETALQECEIHNLKNVRTSTGITLSNVAIYAYKDKNKRGLHLASVINSDFLPKSFDTVKPKDIPSWLKTNLVA